MELEEKANAPEVGEVRVMSEEKVRKMEEAVQEKMKPYLEKSKKWHREMYRALMTNPMRFDGMSYAA